MPKHHDTSIPLTGRRVTDTSDGSVTDLGELRGVQLMVLMRHRH